MNRLRNQILSWLPDLNEQQRLHNRRFREHDSIVISLDSSNNRRSRQIPDTLSTTTTTTSIHNSSPSSSNDSQCILNSEEQVSNNDTSSPIADINNNVPVLPITSTSRMSESRRARRHRRRNRRAQESSQNHRNGNSNNHRRTSSSNYFSSSRGVASSGLSNLQSLFGVGSPQSFNGKHSERNLLSAFCAVFCIAILAVSLLETRWFFLNGGGCNTNYIGVSHFFAPGRLDIYIEKNRATNTDYFVYKFILPNGEGNFFYLKKYKIINSNFFKF
jgi:hypothetical protein